MQPCSTSPANLERWNKAQLIGDSERKIYVHCPKRAPDGGRCYKRLNPYWDLGAAWNRRRFFFECTHQHDNDRPFRYVVPAERFLGALRRASEQGQTVVVAGLDF